MQALVLLSMRTPALVGLAAVHAVAAMTLANDNAGAALYLLPILLVALLALVPRLAYPVSLTLTALVSLLLVLFTGSIVWSPLAVLMVAVLVFSGTLVALLLAESHVRRRTEFLSDLVDSGAIPADLSSDVVARELRRSRRTQAPVSLILLRVRRDGGAPLRSKLIEFLVRESREFDTVLEISSGEVAVLYANTDQASASRLMERLDLERFTTRVNIASFPDDAVTSQGLLDKARRRETVRPAVEIEEAAPIK